MRYSLLTLAALWVCSGLCVAGATSTLRGCDNGKFLLQRDLLASVDMMWNCPLKPWRKSIQQETNIHTQHRLLPAKPVCMDTPISYNASVPSSGPYRPLGAQSGEYLYCPPQRWLNNLKHGATVLLHHPCVSPHQRLRLSTLTQSCLSDYVVTSHPDLSPRRPLALVSWGVTLELSALTSLDVCDWLEDTVIKGNQGDEGRNRQYNLLLIQPAGQHQNKHDKDLHLHSQKGTPKESVRRCCEQVLMGFQNKTLMEETKTRRGRWPEKVLRRRDAVERNNEEEEDREEEEETVQEAQPGNIIEQEQSTSTGRNQTELDDSRSPDLPLGPGPANGTREALKPSAPSEPLGVGPAGTPVSPHPDLTHGPQNHRQLLTSRSTLQGAGATLSTPAPQDQPSTTGQDSTGLGLKPSLPEPEETRLSPTVKRSAQKSTPSPVYSTDFQASQRRAGHQTGHQTGPQTGHQTGPQTGPQTETQKHPTPSLSRPQPEPGDPHANAPSPPPKPVDHRQRPQSSSPPGGGVAVGLLANGMPRTPRTDEAVWAAAALGFLLVLLVLSVLHTRLYRHWRTSPSLYWHDPRQDYDRVGDVIRRRLKISERRRKRRLSFSRRHEVSLLPNSGSDEDP